MTFPELIVAMFIGVVVMGAGATLLIAAQHTQPNTTDRAAQIQQGRVMAENIVREVRQGETISSATSSGFQILTHVNSQTCGGPPGPKATLCQVTYSCGSTTCTRTERNADGTGTAPPEEVVRGVTGPAVFTYSPGAAAATYVTLTLRFPTKSGAEAVTISDGAGLRNYFQATP